jgi:hypothetical protein
MPDFSFSADDLEEMREAQTDHMLDRCEILSYTAGTANEFNEYDAPTYPASFESECGLDMRSGSERHGLDNTIIQYDATLRMPLSAPAKETDRINVYSRFGEYPDAITYEIVSPIQRGPSCIRLLLRKVVT